MIALPALWALREAFPQAYVTLLSDAHGRPGYVLGRDVLHSTGLVDAFFEYSVHPSRNLYGLRSFINMASLLGKIRHGRFNVLAYLAPRLRTPGSVRRDLMFFRAAGIHHFLAHEGIEPVPPRPPDGNLPRLKHEADHLLDRLRISGIPVPEAGRGRMDLGLMGIEMKAARAWMLISGAGGDGRPVVGVGPGANIPSKVWPRDHYAELGMQLIERFDAVPIVFGGSQDFQAGDELVRRWGRGVNAAGVLKVRESAAALSHCQLFVGNDTGTLHLAAAVGTPCVGIYSAQDWPGRWEPYGTGHVVLRRDVPCAGCRLSVCVERELECLRGISVANVLSACENLLGERTLAGPDGGTLLRLATGLDGID